MTTAAATTTTPTKVLKILMKANWISSKGLCDLWNKLGDGNYRFTKDRLTLEMVWEPPFDYVVVVNSTSDAVPLEKTVYLVMEPVVHDPTWNRYLSSSFSSFKSVWCHRPGGNYNNNEWHLSKTRRELLLLDAPPKTQGDAVSAVLSAKYVDPGHILRIDLAQKAQHEMLWHSYGSNTRFRWKDYRGALPLYSKDEALFPYKYTFNAENTFLPGYYTEKLIDAILAECLCFYMGPPNIEELVDPMAYVLLDMSDIPQSILAMKRAVQEDWYALRLPSIKQAKARILEETGFFPRLHATLMVASGATTTDR